MDLNIGISTNTDELAWARKALAKFAIPLTDGDGVEGERIELENIFNGPIEIHITMRKLIISIELRLFLS